MKPPQPSKHPLGGRDIHQGLLLQTLLKTRRGQHSSDNQIMGNPIYGHRKGLSLAKTQLFGKPLIDKYRRWSEELFPVLFLLQGTGYLLGLPILPLLQKIHSPNQKGMARQGTTLDFPFNLENGIGRPNICMSLNVLHNLLINTLRSPNHCHRSLSNDRFHGLFKRLVDFPIDHTDGQPGGDTDRHTNQG